MVKLLAKNLSEGRYYYTEDNENVQMIEYPFEPFNANFVDVFSVFLRKGIDAGLDFDSENFENILNLVEFAKNDYLPVRHEAKIDTVPAEQLSNILVFAPLATVMAYFERIENMIESHNFVGVDTLIKQLSASNLVQDDDGMKQRIANIKESFDTARFPDRDPSVTIPVKVAVKKNKNFLSLEKDYAKAS